MAKQGPKALVVAVSIHITSMTAKAFQKR